MKKILTASLLLLFVFTATAQKPTPVNQALENFNKMVGTWQAKAKYKEGNSELLFKINLTCKKLTDVKGFSMDQVLTNTADASNSYKRAALVGYDAAESKLRWFSIDGENGTDEYLCNWETPQKLVLLETNTKAGKPHVEKTEYTFTSADELHITMTGTIGGEQAESVEGVFTRKVEKKK